MENGLSPNTTGFCVPVLDREWFYVWMLLPSVVAIIIVMLLQRRSAFRLDCCHGRPSLATIGNILDGRTHRLAYAASFALVGSALLNLFYGFFPFPASVMKGDLWVPALWSLLAVVVYAIDFYPLFACISLAASGMNFGYFMGAFFSWAWLAALLDEFFECTFYKNVDPAEFLIIFDMPSLICAAFLSIWFPIGLIMSICNYQGHKGELAPWYDRLTIQAMTGRSRKEHRSSDCSLVCKSICYIGIPGFRYSTVMISTIFVSFCILYKIYCVVMVYLVPIYGSIAIGAPSEINRTMYALGLQSYYPKNDTVPIEERIKFFFDIMEASLIVSITVAFAVCVFILGFILSNYRSNILAMYKGIRLVLPPKLARKSPGSYMEASMKFFGYQIVHLAFGFFVQSIVLFIIAFLLAFVFFIPIIYGWGLDVLLGLCFTLGPWVILVIVILVGQAWASYTHFTRNYENKPTIALNNRKSYYNCWYLMFFFEFFWGWIVAVFRMIQGIFYGCILIARCDLSMLNWRFEHQDPALQSYVAMLQVEVAHSHPILLSFCKILLHPVSRRWRNKMLREDVESDGDNPKRQVIAKRMMIRSRWFLAYTLLHNPQLKHLRKQRIKARAERRKGAAKLTTMSTQTPRHIAIQTKPEELLLNQYYPEHPVRESDIKPDFSDINETYH